MSDLLQMKMKDWNLCPVFFCYEGFFEIRRRYWFCDKIEEEIRLKEGTSNGLY